MSSMIGPDFLLPLWEAHREAIAAPVRTFAFPRFMGGVAAGEAMLRITALQLLNDGRLGLARRIF